MKELISQLTLEEKAALVSGTHFMYTNDIPRLNIPAVRVSDGPHGLRVQKEGGDNGTSDSNPATCFPPAVTTASSWNPNNAYLIGQAIGEEANENGINVVLGPACNIKRNPRCGRNFEYYSEDPYLASEMAIAEVNGLQSKNVGACMKHFALNNSENYRFMGDSIADERAIREIYFKVFERIIKKSHPWSVMCAYNQINGIACSENKWLLTDVLRKEWGFDGLVMTDWGAIKDRNKGLLAGLDLEMPGDTAICRKAIIDGVNNGTLDEKELDKCVLNVLELIEKSLTAPKGVKADYKAHHDLAAKLAEDSAVLLENDGVLPLKDDNYLVVGDLFKSMRYQGAGSSLVHSMFLTTPEDAFKEHGVKYEFVRGYCLFKNEVESQYIEEAVQKAASYDKVIVFAGLTDYVEFEGSDRENISLPNNQLALIDALIRTGKKIIVVLYGGSVVELPFAKKVNALLNMMLPGQNGGLATYDLLFGVVNPSGRLSETWVKSYEDVPFGKSYGTSVNEVYKESIFVGYRYYSSKKNKVLYPFGYGLSYTSFAYSGLNVREDKDKLIIECEVKNTGSVNGAEVVQIYVKGPSTDVYKPEKELKGFSKVYLKPNESQTVNIAIEKDDLRYFNIKEERWILEDGVYEIQACSNVNQVELSKEIKLEGETLASPYSDKVQKIYGSMNFKQVTDEVFEEMAGIKIPPEPAKKPITLETRFSEFEHSHFLGRMLYKILQGVAAKQIKQAKKLPEGEKKENMIKGGQFLSLIFRTNSCRSLSMSAGQSMPYNIAQGFVDFGNGKLFKGIKHFCTKIKVPKLPREEKGK